MRGLLAALALTACASAPAAPTQAAPATAARTPLEIVHGCWIERRERETITMRWLPDRENAARFNGDILSYGPQGPYSPGRFWIERDGHGWRFCQAAESCWPIGEAAARRSRNSADYFDVEGGDARLALSFVNRFGDSVTTREFLFQGARDGCD